jgi:hypothetical protein
VLLFTRRIESRIADGEPELAIRELVHVREADFRGYDLDDVVRRRFTASASSMAWRMPVTTTVLERLARRRERGYLRVGGTGGCREHSGAGGFDRAHPELSTSRCEATARFGRASLHLAPPSRIVGKAQLTLSAAKSPEMTLQQ